MTTQPRHPRAARDRGTVLPLALVVSVVMSLVVVSVASFVATGLRYGQVVESRADRLAAADGGMRYAVERLRLGASRICATSGGDYIDPPNINGTTVTVRCWQAGNGFDDVNGWALVLTGEEIPASCSGDDCALVKTQAGASTTKLVGGPTYMNRLRFATSAPLEFRYSQLLHTEADCSSSTASVPGNVSFDSTSLGLACTERPWSADADPVAGLFSSPNVGVLPAASGATLNPAPIVDGNGCKVFEPGYYTAEPVLGSHNYFKSGNYVFDGFTLEIKQAKVTAGRAAADGSDGAAQFIPNTTCNTARNSDTNGITTAGATFYLRNGARFVLNAHGQFEVMRRKQGKSYVSIHVLDDSLTWNQDVIEQGPGTNKDMAVHGLVWAPQARMTFSNVTNTANGQLLGGAVLSNIDMRSSASAIGFIIAVSPSDLSGKLVLDSIAEKDGATTTVRSVIDYRPSTNYAAVTSWRVID